jgi:amidase
MKVPVFESALKIAERVRRRELSALEVVEAHLARTEALNEGVNAVVFLASDHARERARAVDRLLDSGEHMGPLAGVPLTVKDMYEVAGMPSTSGTLGRVRYVPPQDATVVERLCRAGAIVIGKSNTPEFGMALETTNLIFGTTNNPFDPARTSGGSSGGAAAALAAGFCALDVGSDGGGSIRLPAHYCGVAGLKPTRRRISQAGHFPLHTGIASSMAGYGPLARSVADLRVAFELMVGEDPRDPNALPAIDERFERPLSGLRVAYFTDNGVASPTAETAAVIERCAAALDRAGARLTLARLPNTGEAFDIHLALLAVDRILVDEWAKAAGTETLHPWVAAGRTYLDEIAAEFDSNSPSLLHDDWQIYRREALRFMDDYDIVLGPAAPAPAPLHELSLEAGNLEWSSYASIYNVTGWPAAVVRCGTSPEGLPIAAQLAARPFRERLVLSVAEFLERELGGFSPPPRFA